MLLFRVQTKQTPVHNNEPANDREIYIQHGMNVDLAGEMSPRYVLQKVSLRKENPVESVSTARRSLTPCFQNSVVSRQNSRGWKQASCVAS